MILVTGGAGYIGSHICLELILAGMSPIVIDNFSNSSDASLKAIACFTGKEIPTFNGDIRDKEFVRKLFQRFDIESVIHLAGVKVLAESRADPLRYFDNNVSGTTTLCQVMSDMGCKQLVFSSSASIYAEAKGIALTESSPIQVKNPYAHSKQMAEDILQCLHLADETWHISILRYFNPVGAHHSGIIGESPTAIATNLIPAIIRVAQSQTPYLSVFGDDYDTPDGTAIRDYLHVQDLAKAHIAALLAQSEQPAQLQSYNIGTGTGYSVLEVIQHFEKTNNLKIPYKIKPRRTDEIGFSLANPNLAAKALGWKAELSISQMCLDSWSWASNPVY